PLWVGRHEALAVWFPAINVGIGNEKVVHVPERNQKLPSYLIGALIAKGQIVLGLMGTVEPAHDIDTHATGGFVEFDRVAPALMHGTPIFSQQGGIAKALPERCTVVQHRGHGEQTVEPVTELSWEGLADPVSRVPGAPVVTVAPVAQRTETDNP